MGILDTLEQVSKGQFVRPSKKKIDIWGVDGRFLMVAARASLNQQVAYFETDDRSLTLMRDYEGFSHGDHMRVRKPDRLPEGYKKRVYDPITYIPLRSTRNTKIKDFFVLIEHCVYSIVKWNFASEHYYPENASWESHGERLTRLQKEKFITRKDQQHLRKLSEVRNRYFHSMLWERSIDIYGVPLSEISSSDGEKMFEELLEPTLKKIWAHYEDVQHRQVNWEVFSTVFSLVDSV